MSLLDADTGGNIVNLQRADCAQLFFVYAAALSQKWVAGMNQITFLRRSGLMGRNVTFIRDPETVVQGRTVQTRIYENGISPDLPDMDAVIDWQKEYAASLPHVKEVYAVGNSFGGWSALLFGYILGMNKVFALAPGGKWGLPLLKGLLAEDNGVTDFDIYYAPEVEDDRVFAETFDGFPRTRLIPCEGYGHNVMRKMLQTDELARLMPEFVSAVDD